MMAKLRLVLWGAVFVLGAFLAYSTVTWSLKGDVTNIARVQIGGPFEAQDTKGNPFTQQAMMGRPHIVFFGFTHCPDVCPTTLYETTQWLEKLGEDGKKIDAYFVTVDPKRDTAKVMDDYLTPFQPGIKGITGTEEQIAALSKLWRVYAEKVPLEDDDYTMNHTATTYLMNADGAFFGTIAYGENADSAVQKLKRLLNAQS
ncbi:MAG: SCO family protein [Pseudomonadota bacterium]